MTINNGMGGGIGVQIVTQLRQELPLDVEILALGANAAARCPQFMFAPRRTFSYRGSSEPIDEAIELLPSSKGHRG